MSEQGQADTEKLPFQRSADGKNWPIPSASVRVDIAGLSDKGKVRPNNEDHYLIICFGRFLETLGNNLPEGELPESAQEVGHGMVVADGMGGHSAGEVASRRAIQTLIQSVLDLPDWILLPKELLVEEVLRRAADRLQKIHQVLTEEARADPQLHRMGTTMTAAWSLGNDLFISHVGDSRAYRLRQGSLKRLTHDDTVAQAMADQGYIRQDEVAKSRLRHMLTQTLGGGADKVKAQIHPHHLVDGDCLLLCTDGLTDMVDEQTITTVLGSGEVADKTCQRLVDLALERGGKDNVTAVVARYTFPAAE